MYIYVYKYIHIYHIDTRSKRIKLRDCTFISCIPDYMMKILICPGQHTDLSKQFCLCYSEHNLEMSYKHLRKCSQKIKYNNSNKNQISKIGFLKIGGEGYIIRAP